MTSTKIPENYSKKYVLNLESSDASKSKKQLKPV